MLDTYFKEKFPFCHNYFSNLLEQVKENKRKFPQAIIFEGTNTKLQYLFSMELARALNSDKDEFINSKWIRNFSHPAVNNVSEIHFKPDDDTSKTVISVKQAKAIENCLRVTSDYHRFFIFFSSKECTYNDFELEDFEKSGYTTDINFSIEPLEYTTFHPASLNALLKSIEEPPENTTFVFLTKSKENILPTVVSRCLVFKLNSNTDNSDYGKMKDLFSFYPVISREKVYDLCEKFADFAKENQLATDEILNKFSCYMKDLIKINPDLYVKIMNDIKIINLARKMIKASVSEKNVLEAMFFNLAGNKQ